MWALVKNGGNLLSGIGSGETIIANNTLGYGVTAAGGFGYSPSEVYMSAKQCEDNIALTRAIYDIRIKDLQEKTGKDKEYCDTRMMEHVREHGYHLDKEMLDYGLLLLDFEDEEPWSVEETERARKNNNLHFTGEFSPVNKYDFNFIMNKKKVKEKYEGKSINELAYNTYKSLTDDSFPYPEAKAYFIFLTYLYSTMAEKHDLFR